MMLMRRPVAGFPPVAVVGASDWRDSTVRSIMRAGNLVRQSYRDQLHSSSRYRRNSLTYRLTDDKDRSGRKEQARPKPAKTTTISDLISGPFPLPALREQSAEVSLCMAAEYMRDVREVEGHLRRQVSRVNQEGTKVDHQREQLEKLLRNLRNAVMVNQQSTDGRTRRPGTSETIWDGADDLLRSEQQGLIQLKQELESNLKRIINQQQALSESNRQLLYCVAERSRVTELLPLHGSLSAGVKSSLCPLLQKPHPSGPFTPECKQAMDSASTTLQESQQLRENITQVMSDVIRKQKSLHQSASQALLKKIAETTRLEHHLTLSSAATRQAISRRQRQMQCADYSLGRSMGPVCSMDLFCKDRLSRPLTQFYQKHPSVGLPESNFITQGSSMLRKHLESSRKDVAELQVVHQQLENDRRGKRMAAKVDFDVVRLRHRLQQPSSVRPTTG